MATASVNGVDLYYDRTGVSDGTAVVFGTGPEGDSGRWTGEVGGLSEYYHLTTWDPRGHGKSKTPAPAGEDALKQSAGDLKDLMDQLGIERAFVGGQSISGGIALHFAAQYPERVIALIMVDLFWSVALPMSAMMRAVRERSIELAESEGMEAVMNYCIEADPVVEEHARYGAQALEEIRGIFLSLDAKSYASSLRTMLDADFPPDLLSSVKVPTLLIGGDEDPKWEVAVMTHTMIPDSQYVVLPNTRHLTNLERFNNHLLEFLDEMANRPMDQYWLE